MRCCYALLAAALVTSLACGQGTVIVYDDHGSALSSIWKPKPGTSWQIQYGSGIIDTSLDVDAYDLDLVDGAAAVRKVRMLGKRVICYFSAGSYEAWRPDANQFAEAVLGNPLDGWPGERWLDIRAQSVRDIMVKRLDLAAKMRCDAVHPDNVDGFQNDSGFPLTAADQLAFNKFIATEAHKRFIAVGLKNDLDQIPALIADFDFAINEECFEYGDCDELAPFIAADKAVFSLEYGRESLAASICPEANSRNFDTLVKNLGLDAFRISCR